jgi:acyl-CoA thioester hydrolase
VLEIYVRDQHLISGELTYVYANTAQRKSTPIPDAWRATITAIEKLIPVSL